MAQSQIEQANQQILEAEAQQREAEQQLALEREAASQAQEKVNQQREILENPNRLRKEKLGYLLAPKFKQQRLDALNNLNVIEQRIVERKQELNKFESEQLRPSQQNIEAVKEKVEQAQEFEKGFEVARKDKIPIGLSREARKGYRAYNNSYGELEVRKKSLLQDLEKAGLKPVFEKGNIVGFEDVKQMRSLALDLEPVSRKSIENENIKNTFNYSSGSDISKYSEFSRVFSTLESTRQDRLSSGMLGGSDLTMDNSTITSQGIVEAIPQSEGLEKYREDLARLNRQTDNQFKGFTIALATTGVGIGLLGKSILTSPIKTVKESGLALYGLSKRIVKDRKLPEIGRMLSEKPGYSTGIVFGEILLAKGTNLAAIKAPGAFESVIVRLDPKFRPVVLDQFKQAPIQTVKNIPSIEQIGLIPPGSPRLPKDLSIDDAPPTVRGGFGYSEEQLKTFLGQKGAITSQRDLLPRFKDIRELAETEPGLGLFATPRSPIDNQLSTRVSRLGDTPSSPSFLDLISEDINIGFSSSRPQILVFEDEIIGGKNFALAPKLPSTELEVATKSPALGGPTAIIKRKRLAVTAIGKKGKPGFLGRAVNIYSVEFGDVVSEAAKIGLDNVRIGKSLTRKQKKALKKETGFSQSDFLTSRKVISPISFLPSIRVRSKPLFTTTIRTSRINKISANVRLDKFDRNVFTSKRNNKINNAYSLPRINNIYGLTSRSALPTYKSLVRPPVTTPIYYSNYGRSRKYRNRYGDKRVSRTIRRVNRSYTVFVKRGKKFVGVRTGLTRGRALSFGSSQTQRELSRQFKIVESGVTEMEDISFTPNQRTFRTFKVRRGQRQQLDPDRFIQNTIANLQTVEEKSLIRQARARKRNTGFF